MIQLAAMSAQEYMAWLDGAIADYAQDKVAAGNWSPASARQRAEAEYAKLLPDGLLTPRHHLFTILAGLQPQPVGMIWFAEEDWGGRRVAFIYDFLIHEPFRRHGYGLEAILALEEKVKALSLDVIGLHVFGHNRAALALYQKAGYEITNINMAKRLTPA